MSLADAQTPVPCVRIWLVCAASPITIRLTQSQRGEKLPAPFSPLGATLCDTEDAMTTANRCNRQWRLKSRPTGLIKPDNFELVSEPVPDLGDGQLLIRNVYLSLDPAMRGWLVDRPSYVPPVQIGD